MPSGKIKKEFKQSIENLQKESTGKGEGEIGEKVGEILQVFTSADGGVKDKSMVSLLEVVLNISLAKKSAFSSTLFTFDQIFTGDMPEAAKALFELKLKNNTVAQTLVIEMAERLKGVGSGKNFYYINQNKPTKKGENTFVDVTEGVQSPETVQLSTIDQAKQFVWDDLKREEEAENWLDRKHLERAEFTGIMSRHAQTKAANAAGSAKKQVQLATAGLANDRVVQEHIDTSLQQAKIYKQTGIDIARQHANVLAGGSALWEVKSDHSANLVSPSAPIYQK